MRYEEPRGRVVAWCLDPHDLWVSKAIAGRPKDRDFCDSLLQLGLVDRGAIQERILQLDRATDAQRARAEAWLGEGPGP